MALLLAVLEALALVVLEQAVLAAFECLEREELPQQPKTILAIARRALELALEKNTKPADEVPKLVQDSRYLLAS